MNGHRGNFESNLLFLEKSNILRPGQKILEVGSGLGFLVKHLRAKGFDVTGTEMNGQYIETAKIQNGVDIVRMAGDKLAFPDGTFDVVLSFDVFEHIPDTDQHLQEVARVLKPEGHYLFGTPNKITNIPFEILKERSFTKYKEYHCSLHTYGELKERLAKNGFKSEFIDIPLVTTFFKAKVKKYLGWFGLVVIKIINPDKLPIFLKTNFYVIAKF